MKLSQMGGFQYVRLVGKSIAFESDPNEMKPIRMKWSGSVPNGLAAGPTAVR